MEIAVSFLKSPYALEETIKRIEETSAEYIHVDLADGLFVSNKNYNWNLMHSLLDNHQKDLDIHLMTLDLERNIEESLSLNPKKLSFHFEANKEVEYFIQKIKESGVMVGLAIKESTEVETIVPYLKELDFVLVMSIVAGYGGQKFLMNTIKKLQQLKEYQKEYQFQIEVDGGINLETIDYVKETANIIVSGSFICESEDYEQQIQKLKEKIK